MSPDGSHVYVSETSGNRIAIFSRDPVSGGLKPTEVVDIDSAPDNLNVAPDGAVWIGAHAKVLALVRHFGDPKSLAPTQILKLLPDPKAPKRLTQVYLNLGEQISAGSGGAVIDGQLLIGSITERKVLQCRLP